MSGNGAKTESVEPSEDEVGKTCELRVRQQRFDRNGNAENVVVDSRKLPRGYGSDKNFAVAVNQIFTNKNKLEKEVLEINSQHILEAFREVIRSYPTVASDFSDPFDLESPFQMLYHYWEELEEYREDVEDDVARMHIALLLDFMDTAMGPERKKIQTQVKKGQIDFSRAWAIFRPGDLLLRDEHGEPWLIRCQKTAYEENTREGKYLEVHCSYTDFDGTHVGKARQVIKIHQKRYWSSENPADIDGLLVYPRKFHSEGMGLEERLEKRGKQFLALNDTCVRQYDGYAEHIKEPPSSYYDPDMALFDPVWVGYRESGRVVVDRRTFQEDNDLTRVDRLDPEDVEAMLCAPYVYGYSLAVKEWCRFYLRDIHDVEWNRNCMETLVMKQEQKNLLHALVSSHHFPENPRDQTKQKGKGLVILLHGSPGSGKTLTAESCAEITGRALFSTSLAELNKENFPWWFEQRLVQVLQYATIWKAVVLMDEADVFLEHRRDDIAGASERNSLVAIFLRHLEYFSGIVFLTTNRIHVFDEAMKSRIHLALGYGPPEIEMRRVLWTNCLKATLGRDLDPQVEEAIDVFTRTKLNGREISNAINTAQTLARFEKQELQLKHIEQVLNVRRDFEMGLRKMVKEEAKRSSTGLSLTRRGSMLGAMTEEPEEL